MKVSLINLKIFQSRQDVGLPANLKSVQLTVKATWIEVDIQLDKAKELAQHRTHWREIV